MMIETDTERYHRILDFADAFKQGKAKNMTYYDALFLMDYVAKDNTKSPGLRKAARRRRRKLISQLLRKRDKEAAQ